MTERKALPRQQWLVWCCWSAGMSLKQTSYSLMISLHTVHSYRDRLRRKGWDWLS